MLLIEVNTSPALFRAGRYLSDLLPRVVEEVVQKAIDPFLPPPVDASALPEPLSGFEKMDLPAAPANRRSSSFGRAGPATTAAAAAPPARVSPGAAGVTSRASSGALPPWGSGGRQASRTSSGAAPSGVYRTSSGAERISAGKRPTVATAAIARAGSGPVGSTAKQLAKPLNITLEA